MDLIAKHSPLIDKKLKAVGNAKYTSNTIQNEILECLSDMVWESIISEVKENKYFSIIVDLKKKEQLSLVLRYYYNGAVHESFLDFKQATEGLQILFKWFNLDSYYPRPDSMYNCALSQSSHVDCQTLICVNPWQMWIRFRLIELVSMHLIMLMRLEPREVW